MRRILSRAISCLVTITMVITTIGVTVLAEELLLEDNSTAEVRTSDDGVLLNTASLSDVQETISIGEGEDTDSVDTVSVNSTEAMEDETAADFDTYEGDMPHYSDNFGLSEPKGSAYEYGRNSSTQTPEAYSEKADLISPDGATNANVIHYQITANNKHMSFRYPIHSYYACIPFVILLRDYKGLFNVATAGILENDTEHIGYSITKYDPDSFSLVESMTIEPGKPEEYRLVGNITCDMDGFYYAVWGSNSAGELEKNTICVSKYDYSGNLVKELELKGSETRPTSDETWGTSSPFHAGNCAMAINNGILAINYARTMYNGHQSNMMLYINTSDMSRIEGSTVYTSHSFDERIYPAGSDCFVVANQGDAYGRGFEIGVVKSNGTRFTQKKKITTFHFREGVNRGFGYNETFAQLGGLTELRDAYAFAASSERELSLQPGNFMGDYGHYGARDLFIQILNKDFYENNSGTDIYKVSGETRRPTGTKPEEANTELFLNGDEEDKGIIWLTSYDSDHYAGHPKIVALTEDTFAVLWDKMSYSNGSAETYYMVLDTQGNIVAPQMKIGGCILAADIDPIVYNGEIYWATVDEYGEQIHRLNVSNSFSGVEITEQPYISSKVKNPDGSYSLDLTVKAANAVSYKWYSSDNGFDWNEAVEPGISGQITNKLSINNYGAGSKAFYRCVMKDSAGRSVVSNTAVGILEEPVDVRGTARDMAVFEIKALGGATYTWYGISSDGYRYDISKWNKVAGNRSSKVTMEINKDSGSYKYICIVRSRDGQEIYSNPVSIRRNLTILEQPHDIYGKKGESFTISFVPDGEEVTYQWYMKPGNDPWVGVIGDLGTFPRLTWRIDDIILNSKFKCVVKDKYGDSLETNTVRVYENMKLVLDKHSVTLISKAGSTATLNAEIIGPYDANSLVWSSSDTSVVTVDNGLITAKEGLNEERSAEVTVKTEDGELSDTCEVTVVPLTNNIKELEVNLYEGDTANYSELAKTSSDEIYIIDVMDPSVASINEKGVITGIKAGNTKATVTKKTVIYNVSISVKAQEQKKTSQILVVGGKITDISLAKDKADGKKYSIAYTEKGIVAVSDKGVIQGKKPGHTVVTVTKVHSVHTLDIEVINPMFTARNYTKNTGDKFNAGLDAKGLKVDYSSSKPAIASVDDQGNITANIKGSATVNAIVQGKKYSTTVKVYDPKITAKTDTLLTDGKTINLSVKDGNGKTEWSSSDTSVATVANGRVKGLSKGVAIITAVNNGRTMTKEIKVFNVPKFEYKVYPTNVGEPINVAITKDPEMDAEYSINNTKIASINQDGTLTPLGKGSVTVTTKAGGKAYKTTVKIFDPMINGKDTVKSGKTLMLSIKNGNGPTTWSVSDTSIATITDKGKLTGIKSGTVTVAAVNNGRTMTKEITVE